MTNKQKLFGVALVIVGFAVGFLVAGSFGAKVFGGVYSLSEKNFGQGITVGTGEEFSVSSAGVVTSSAANTWSGAQTLSSTLGVTGATTLSSTLGVTATTTLSSGLVLSKNPLCIDTYATSSATRVKLTLSAVYATSTSPVGFVAAYGTCN